MKRNLFQLIFALCLANNLLAQAPLFKQWDYRFGGINDDYFYSLQLTSDMGYILGGYSYSGISGDKSQASRGGIDFWVVKLDTTGIKQWDKRFGGTDDDLLRSIVQTNDNGYLLGGSSRSPISGDKSENSWGSYDYWIVKIDSLGNKLWDKRYGGVNDDFLFSVQQTNDGGYILGGGSSSGISGDKTQPSWGGYDFWIVKINSIGIKQWDYRFGGIDNDVIIFIQKTNNGGYILSGGSFSGITGDKTEASWGNGDYWLVKIDSLGNKQWDKDFGGTGADNLFSMLSTSDGGFILGGKSNSDSTGTKTQPSWGFQDYWIVKIDSSGNKQWDKDFGGTSDEDEFGNVILSNGGYLLIGASYSNASGNKSENNLGQEQTWIVKTDLLGNILWDKTIFTPGHDEWNYLVQTSNNCFALANQTNAAIGGFKTQPNWDPTNNTYDYWIIKFCDTTVTTSINQIANTQSQFSIYPNPTNTILNLFLNKTENITITNVIGEIILNTNAKGKVELDVSFLASGIYFIRAGNEVRKFVKE